MLNIIYKELKLSASKLTYLFILFGLMFFLPGYPILCGGFFSTLGIFQSFQNMAETNDLLFSLVLPIRKKDIVKGKYLFVCFIELSTLVLMSIVVVIRNTILVNGIAYRNNALMNSNLFALAVALIIFALFNLIFVNGFFKTAYKRTKPFVLYTISCFVVIIISEVLHYLPNLQFLNSFGNEYLDIQLIIFICGIIIYILITLLSYKKSCYRFEMIDM